VTSVPSHSAAPPSPSDLLSSQSRSRPPASLLPLQLPDHQRPSTPSSSLPGGAARNEGTRHRHGGQSSHFDAPMLDLRAAALDLLVFSLCFKRREISEK
jgi:hypothetical protein